MRGPSEHTTSTSHAPDFAISNLPKRTRFRVVDLYAGAGLFGLAFALEGFKLVAAYEQNKIAVATHKRNLPGKAIQCDLSAFPPEGNCDVIIAGPPCQGFSTMGKRQTEDPRNLLCGRIAEWAKHCSSKVVVVENVPQFLVSEAYRKLSRSMQRLGYRKVSFCLNAKDFGVAQNRNRSFTVFVYCLDEFAGPPVPEAVDITSVATAFAGLPPFPHPPIQHVSLKVTELQSARYRLLPVNGDIRDIAKADPSLVPAAWYSTRGKIVDAWGRLSWHDVSNTIRTGFEHSSRGRFVHPAEDRPISFREAARLQSVPDWFHFEGQGQQIARQIGNGVPVLLGRHVARFVRSLLREKK